MPLDSLRLRGSELDWGPDLIANEFSQEPVGRNLMFCPDPLRQVTPMCDRASQSRVALQRGFVDAVAGPLFRAAARLLPGLAPAVRQLEENRAAMAALTDAELLEEVRTIPWAIAFIHPYMHIGALRAAAHVGKLARSVH